MWSSNQKNKVLKKYLETFVANKLAEIFTTKPKVWQLPPPFGKWKLCLVFTDYFSSLSLTILCPPPLFPAPPLSQGAIFCTKCRRKKAIWKLFSKIYAQSDIYLQYFLAEYFPCLVLLIASDPDSLPSWFRLILPHICDTLILILASYWSFHHHKNISLAFTVTLGIRTTSLIQSTS